MSVSAYRVLEDATRRKPANLIVIIGLPTLALVGYYVNKWLFLISIGALVASLPVIIFYNLWRSRAIAGPCPGCGTELEVKDSSGKFPCPNCGKTVRINKSTKQFFIEEV